MSSVRLRELLAADDLVVAPGAYDGLTAKMVEQAGFPAVYMTGAGVAASHGMPDYGLITMSEMAGALEKMTTAVSIPVIADADTGFGDELSVVRAVAEYTRCGAAAIQLEDQTFPKRCGHLDQKEVVDADEFVRKIRAAVESRTDPQLVVIARTDAVAVNGFDDAIDRANRALQAGADMVFVEAPQTAEMIAEIPSRVSGPCLFNIVGQGKSPPIGLAEIQALGYRMAIVPVMLTAALLSEGDAALRELANSGRYPENRAAVPVSEIFRRVGADEWDSARGRWGKPA